MYKDEFILVKWMLSSVVDTHLYVLLKKYLSVRTYSPHNTQYSHNPLVSSFFIPLYCSSMDKQN